MRLLDYISHAVGRAAPLLILVIGAVSGIVLFGKVKSGELSLGWQSAKVRIAQKNSELEALHKELAVAREQMSERIEMEEKAQMLVLNQTAINELRERNAAARSRLESLRLGLEQTAEMFDDYKQRYRHHVRSNAVGTKLDQLTTQGGRTYHQVEIKSVGAVGVNITHRDGSGRIPYKELPYKMQRRFQFDEEEAEAQQKREAELRRKRELAAAAARSALENQEAEIIGEPKISEVERGRAMYKLKEAIREIEERIIIAETNLRTERKKSISRAPQYRIELKELRAALKKNKARLSELKSMR